VPAPQVDRWQSRPLASALLRGAVFVVPIVIAAGISVWFVRSFVGGRGTPGLLLRWGCSFAISLIVLRVTDIAARRLLPLAVLWKLSLAFPSEAPSRWKLARRSGNVRELEAIAERARAEGVFDEPARAAEHILTLVAAQEAHDRGTRGHSERVRIYADLIAEQLKLEEDDRNKLRWAALLHDVGKLMVPANTLNKPDKLDEDEWDLVKQHPIQGMRFIEPLREWLGEWALAVEQHHERYDGHGYPHGLSGWRIARAARIVSVADSYEVMTARRAYRKPVRAAEARAELVKCSGTQFDPAMVRAFLQVSLGRLRLVSGPLAWAAQVPFLRGIESIASGSGAATTGGAIVLGLVPALPQVVAPTYSPKPPAVIAQQTDPSGSPTPSPVPPFLPPTPSASAEPEPSGEPTDPSTPGPSRQPEPTPKPTSSPSPTPTSSPSPTPTRTFEPGPQYTPTGSPQPEPGDPDPIPPITKGANR
jgi:putative nucleotidyltransferase with HDIG domain